MLCWCSCCCAASTPLLLSHSCCCDGLHALFPGKPIAWLSEPQRQRRQLALTCKSYPFKSVRSQRDDCRTLASVITEKPSPSCTSHPTGRARKCANPTMYPVKFLARGAGSKCSQRLPFHNITTSKKKATVWFEKRCCFQAPYLQ